MVTKGKKHKYEIDYFPTGRIKISSQYRGNRTEGEKRITTRHKGSRRASRR